jgi:hypothetical protein
MGISAQIAETTNLMTEDYCADKQRNAETIERQQAEIERLRHLIRFLVPADLDDEKGIWIDGASGQWRFWHGPGVLKLIRETLG